MVEKVKLLKEKIEQDGVFNYRDFYRAAFQWYRDELYDPVMEERYQEKIMPDGTRSVTIMWRIVKNMSAYFRIDIWMKIEIFGLTDVEVEVDGKKKKLNKGRMLMEIEGSLVKDPYSKWERGIMKNFKTFRHLYDKYIIPGKIERLEDYIKDDVREYKERLKDYLNLQGRRELGPYN